MRPQLPDPILRHNGEKYGQPHQVALKRIASVMDSSDIRRGDTAAFEKLTLQVQLLLGVLKTLGPDGDSELRCGFHVARLLSKLPPEMRSDFCRCMFHQPGAVYTLQDFSEWLQYESWCQDFDGQTSGKVQKEKHQQRFAGRYGKRTASVHHGAKESPERNAASASEKRGGKAKQYCPYCENAEHYLSQCSAIQKLTKEQGKHLQVLHEVNARTIKEAHKEESCLVSTATEVLYLDRPTNCSRVLLKVVRVFLHHGNRTLDTYAILDDRSERTMLLPAATLKLGLQGTPEGQSSRTSRPFMVHQCHSASRPRQLKRSFHIEGAFTATQLGIANNSYPVASLQRRYKHLVSLPYSSLTAPSLSSPRLIAPIKPVRLGPPGGPAAIRTRLGWTVQGPARFTEQHFQPQQCLLAFIAPANWELFRNVETLWQFQGLNLNESLLPGPTLGASLLGVLLRFRAVDLNPVTPNLLLMGRPDGSLPQVVYPETELLSQRRWKHSQILTHHF
ncbi:hypothetical protein AAFF_G00115050 [Aldrovandia affinis]|uniref:Uncharacterized protein n=1 Tax=Aldrovandia affinis TaxID=143900 RepID=A0AAD7RSX3_9TELE|nr:hypothetical protein AAFF_G00115050 [Aldrovandia affinis]